MRDNKRLDVYCQGELVGTTAGLTEEYCRQCIEEISEKTYIIFNGINCIC